ncbi:hypothetical protein D3C73_1608950 [compost metagenome]
MVKVVFLAFTGGMPVDYRCIRKLLGNVSDHLIDGILPLPRHSGVHEDNLVFVAKGT